LTRHAAAFNEVAALYDEIRPGYSRETIEAIVARTDLSPGARILEIGCGTGQITLPLAAKGYAITALEPGDALAALAARKCRPYPRVEIVPTSFEGWPLSAEAFDLVLAAQAFHWIEPVYGCARAAAALRAGGGIALVWHLDVSHYLKLLNTFSDHRALPEPHRTTFFQAITDTIERAGGEVRRRYETTLITARKR
jgi:SAM-dependent methyltransferase